LRCIKALIPNMRERRSGHHQRDFDRGEDGHCASGVLCSLQVGA
jgi:hypothetical protein